MAIEINKDTTKPNNLSKEYRANQIPATQGNVIETLSTYNDELKKKYYDKEQTRADENALQTSIMTLVKLLDAGNTFNGSDKTPDPDTTLDETNNGVFRLKSYEGGDCQDSQKSKNFTESGLIQKINIISHLLSGKKDFKGLGWNADTYGNNVGDDEHESCVPVIGYTRSNPTYIANITKQSDGSHFKVNIEGLNKTEADEDLSDKTVLSEKQIADMISKSVYNVLGQYDSRITGILAYLIYHAGKLPESYEYVLEHYYTDKIEKAPLYITYKLSEDDKGDRWSVHDLNGENEFGVGAETEDFWYEKSPEKPEGNDGVFFQSSDTNSKWNIKIPNPTENEVLEYVDVYYNNSSDAVYRLPLPKKTLTLNLGLEEISTINYTCKFGGVEYFRNFNFSDGTGYVNVPQGSTVIVTLPEGFDGDLFYKYQYGTTTEKVKIEDSKTFTINMENDQEVFAKVLTYTLKNGENTVGSSKKYYKTAANDYADVTFEVNVQSQSKQGYNFTGTTLGGEKDGNKITISLSNIQRNSSYNGITSGEIIDTIDWEPNKFNNVKVHYVLDRNTTRSLDCPIETIDVVVGDTINFTEDIPDNNTNLQYHIVNECGYDFVGLYDSTEFESPITQCPEVNELEDLYALYEIKKYKYNLVLNDGALSSNELTTGTKNWALMSELDSLPTPTRDGYNLEGWYTDINFDSNTKTDTFLNKDATYYAKWKELDYTIKFNLTDTNNENIQPYFKYESINVKASNFPVTLGEPLAEGYKFGNWKLDEEIKETIDINDFNSKNNTITLTANWIPQNVTVLEEIYYEMDSNGANTDDANKKYDLVEVRKNTGIVNVLYSKEDYTCANGFSENSSKFKPLNNVSYKGNVVQRYFDRINYTLKYYNEKYTSDPIATQSFKYSDHNVLLTADPTTPADNYTFDCWVDENGKKVTCIPAHTAKDVNYYAKYNQSAPVLGSDFEITPTKNTSNDTITIRKIGSRTGEKLCCRYKTSAGSIETEEIGTKDITLNYNDIYGTSSKETEFAWIYFDYEQDSLMKRIIVNESSKVEVPLKFSSEGITNLDYTQNESAGTLEKTAQSKGILEYRFRNDEGNDGEWYELNKPLHVEKEDNETKIVKLRRKETFDRLCSEAITVTFDERASQDKPTNDDIQNFRVLKKVSIYQPGQIEVLNGAFGNNNGPLQYRIFEKDNNKPSGSAWLNVERSSGESSVYINVDKECTVYFRYGENAQYHASDSIGIEVGTVMHTVKFHLDDFPSKPNGYVGFPNKNSDGSFTIPVKSGSQLYKCDDYINKVKEWEIFGYTPYTKNLGSDGKTENVQSSTQTVGGLQDSNRVLKFLYVKEHLENGDDIEVPFSELNVIDKDLELYMRFTPSKPTPENWVYTDAIIIDTYNTNAPIEIQDSKTLESSNISYGTNYGIDVIQEIKNDTLCEENLIGVLNWLDEPENNEKIVQFKQLTVSNLNNNTIDNGIIIDNKLTCSYKDEEGCFNVSEDDKFSYKFTSVFELQENTSSLPTVQFKVEVSGGEYGQDINGVLKNISAYGFNSTDSVNPDFTEFKYKLDTSNKLIEFMYKDDPRADVDYVPITDDKINVDNYNEDKINIFFHSGLVNDKMYPAYKKENVSIKKISLPADKNQFYNTVFNSIDYNGFVLKSNWEVKEEGATNNE